MTVSMNTIPADLRVPLFYAEMDNSAANTAQTSAPSLLIGHVNAGASIATNQLVFMPSKDYAIQQCGAGSQLARMVEAYRATDPFGELWVIAVPDTGTAATFKMAVTGTATESGVVSLYIGSRRIQTVVTTGDAVTDIATAIAAAITADGQSPFTAAASAGVVTLTARHKGTWANDIPVSLNYRGFSGGEKLPAGVQIAITLDAAGAGAPALAGTIAAMGDEPFDYIGHPFNDTASVNTFTLEMNDTSGRWSWLRQIYGHVYTAKIAAISDLITVGDMFNDQHLTLAGYEKTIQSNPDELAASRTARAAVFLRIDPARPTQTGELVGMLPPPTGKRFITTEQQSLLTHGIATAYTESGTLRIQRDITTYKKNAYGVADNSYLDSETLHTSAYVLRRLKTVITSKYGRHKLANDGTRFGPGQAIVTPAVIKGELLATYRQMEREGIVENYDLFKKYLIVERDANTPTRINVLYPPDYVNQLRVFAVLNQFRNQYAEESA
ncbi:phage tail sheath subtilisin-like domain-containing protein [Leclercia pneumoniae]|uniref:Phage tail sheath subtilisin-like domain-containing protein n=1 Tax=Leclercia pneumoniae TaxID=2815358 RepID=A0ABX8JP64_9ENTR|nr:phage tail sheath subtilisin-like domain-containing protein [Leclercia pneumoniae]QSW37074.1 phage tail sheath subtilisin-like domain-containing protein [Leclercia pneumoniae]QWW78010.1 phage tail sheath subtilisin-like domain-containing protein [Leclercia pneumoniae]